MARPPVVPSELRLDRLLPIVSSAWNPESERMDTAHDPFDELTSLYLGSVSDAGSTPVSGDGDGQDGGEESPPAVGGEGWREEGVTIALCGHLPVMAGLWVTQYAEKMAAENGPTGLIRLEGGRCLLEILRPDGRTIETDADSPPVGLVDLVEELARDRIRRWIVCVDDRDAAASVRAGADEVVILTAADKPAILEAYRLAKSAAARVADPESLDLGLVLVGMEDSQAEEVSGRLGPVANRHLDRELPVRATVRRIDVVEGSVRRMFDESDRVPAEEIVETILGCLLQPRATGTPDVTAEADDWKSITPPHGGGPRLRIASDDALEELQQPIRFAPEESEVVAGDFPASPAASDDKADGFETPVIVHHAPVDDSAGDTSVEDSPERSLSSLLGLRPVEWRSPNAAGVEYGCDDLGRLHLIARDGDVVGLHVAAAWIAGQQREFAASSGLETSAVEDPCLHVVTEHPPRVADLHRTGLHLHLLAGSGTEVFLVPLNDDSNRTMPS